MSEGLFDKDSDGNSGSDEEEEDGERQLANATVRREDQKSMKQRKQEKIEKDQVWFFADDQTVYTTKQQCVLNYTFCAK